MSGIQQRPCGMPKPCARPRIDPLELSGTQGVRVRGADLHSFTSGEPEEDYGHSREGASGHMTRMPALEATAQHDGNVHCPMTAPSSATA